VVTVVTVNRFFTVTTVLGYIPMKFDLKNTIVTVNLKKRKKEKKKNKI